MYYIYTCVHICLHAHTHIHINVYINLRDKKTQRCLMLHEGYRFYCYKTDIAGYRFIKGA